MADFRLGLNYWPARTAMGWWANFDPAEVSADFARIAAAGFDSVRVFLTWEHFQPQPETVSSAMVERLVTTLDLASHANLQLMPTLFTGHMSGVNWIPGWALGGHSGDSRFRVVSGNRVVAGLLRNWYSDSHVLRAQAHLAGELARAVRGHRALWAWDLGNENSNCVIPPTRTLAREWLQRMTEAIRTGDDRALVTIGLHMEDLEQDRKLGPAEAAEVCDFLTMHGYPGYATWSRGTTDECLLPFLALVTRWLGNGKEVLFSEFGLPTYEQGTDPGSTLLVEANDAAKYVERALAALRDSGCTGAMLWCHADYEKSLWSSPPFDLAVHERFFGQWHADARPKPVLDTVSRFRSERVSPPETTAWIDVEPADFYRDARANLVRMYANYLKRA